MQSPLFILFFFLKKTSHNLTVVGTSCSLFFLLFFWRENKTFFYYLEVRTQLSDVVLLASLVSPPWFTAAIELNIFFFRKKVSDGRGIFVAEGEIIIFAGGVGKLRRARDNELISSSLRLFKLATSVGPSSFIMQSAADKQIHLNIK